mgnify:CR=1 FL=1
MKSKKLLTKISSICSILLYAAVNYYQWGTENSEGSFSPFKISSHQYEHLAHYGMFHVTYLLLITTTISLWFYSFKKVKTTFFIHLSLLSIAGCSAILFKNNILNHITGDFANILINDILQKPIYPLLLLLYFIFEKRKPSL